MTVERLGRVSRLLYNAHRTCSLPVCTTPPTANGGGDAAKLYRRSAGNALHLRMLLSTGGTEDTLDAAIQRYLGGLTARVREVLGYLCVFEPLSCADLAELAGEYVSKGSMLLIEGRMNSRKYEKDGVEKESWELIANTMKFLGGKKDGESHSAPAVDAAGPVVSDDDIPF